MRLQTLSNETHRNLRLKPIGGAACGEAMQLAPVVPAEVPRLAGEYPIFFGRQGEAGPYFMCALLGFAENENLFLINDEWDVRMVPLHFLRMPFHIGPDETGKASIQLDMDDPRVSDAEGVRLFNDDGSPSEELQRAHSILQALLEGAEQTQKLLSFLETQNLLEPLDIRVTFINEQTTTLKGLFGLNHDRLQALSSDQLAQLQNDQLLETVFGIKLSSHKLQSLIDRKNKTL